MAKIKMYVQLYYNYTNSILKNFILYITFIVHIIFYIIYIIIFKYVKKCLIILISKCIC